MKALRGKSQRRAMVLLLVLWIAAILGIMAYSVLYRMTLETRLTSLRKKSVESRALARAGLARAFADLRNDLIFDMAEDGAVTTGSDSAQNGAGASFDAEGDVWAILGYEEDKPVELGNGTWYVTIEDAERYFNINLFNPSNRILLQKIIESIGYEEDDAKIAAASIIDYMDSDDQPCLDSSQGREGIAYAILRGEDEGGPTRADDVVEMRMANERYLTVDGLLEVYGVTPELFFGPETPEAIYYRAKLGPQKGDRFEIKKRRTRRDEKVLGLRDYFTVDGAETLNINTAPVHVLAALFEAAGRTDGERAAESVVRERRGGGGRVPKNDKAFKTVEEMGRSGELGSLLGPMQALHPMDVRSTVFRIKSEGRVGDSVNDLDVTVERSVGVMQRDETFEAIDRAREREQYYEERRERRQDRDNERVVRIPMVRILAWNQP